MRPIIRASSACLLMAAMSAGGCGLEPDEVGSVLAGAIKPDAFSKLNDYYGGKTRPPLADASRVRQQERKVANASGMSGGEPEEPALPPPAVAAVEPPKSLPPPSAVAKKEPAVERRSPEIEGAAVNAPPVIVEPAKPQLLNGSGQGSQAATERKIKPEPVAPVIKPPPVIVEKAKPTPTARDVKPPPVIVEKSKQEPKAAEIKPPPVIVETAKKDPTAPANTVPPILASRPKPGQEAAAKSASRTDPTPEKQAAAPNPAKAETKAAKAQKRQKERWVPVAPTEAELAAAAAKAPAVPHPAATAGLPARRQWITPPPSERELPAANANSPVYSLPPPAATATAAPPPRIQDGRPFSQPAVMPPPAMPPSTTAALPPREKKSVPADAAKTNEPLSFREECLKRAADEAKGTDVADEGISLDEKLAIDALCQKVLKRTATEPGLTTR